MTWCYRFDDYLLEYLLKKGREEIPPQLLCSEKLLLLKKYDDNNKTDLYHTAKVYLELERNVLQTAKELYIHRSTLFYRLERIRKIAGIDFEDSRERLTLRLSFYILEQKLANPDFPKYSLKKGTENGSLNRSLFLFIIFL